MSGVGIQVANQEFLGSDSRPYVTIDGLPFPLVPGSQVEVSPLNPFSPSNADGNTTAVLSQRHATQVWDDFTGGLGYIDDDPDAHQYAYGNLDARQPRAVTVPPLVGGVLTGTFAAGTGTWSNSPCVECQYVASGPADWAFICAQHRANSSPAVVRRITPAGMATTAIPDAEVFRGMCLFNGAFYVLTQVPGGDAHLWKSSGAASALVFTNVITAAATALWGLVVFDDKLITYNATTGAFQQANAGVTAWVAYVGGFTSPALNADEVRQLFVWTDKSGSSDALYCLTNRRILLYDDQGQQWEPLYTYSDLFNADFPYAHVNRRDNTLAVCFGGTATSAVNTPVGNILVFTPGTADNIPLNKGFGFPNTVNYGSGILVPPVNYPMLLASGIHWLFCWDYTSTSVDHTGVFAYNEFGGWTQVLDAKVAAAKNVLGGGYGAGKLLVIYGDGSFAITEVPDSALNQPTGSYDSAAAGNHDYYIQSGRVWNRQRNVLKLGSHLEFTFQDPIPANNQCYAEYRYYNENGLSAWQQSATFPTGKKRVSVDLKDGGVAGGINYYYMEWRFHVMLLAGATAPAVLQFVVLNYTYWQDNHNSYQFAIDLTRETWAEYYPDGGMPAPAGGLYQREGLQQYIVQTLVSAKKYHTFTYVWTNSNFQEVVARADLLISRRESADDLSGVYLCTVRDLEPDTPAAGAGQHGVA